MDWPELFATNLLSNLTNMKSRHERRGFFLSQRSSAFTVHRDARDHYSCTAFEYLPDNSCIQPR